MGPQTADAVFVPYFRSLCTTLKSLNYVWTPEYSAVNRIPQDTCP